MCNVLYTFFGVPFCEAKGQAFTTRFLSKDLSTALKETKELKQLACGERSRTVQSLTQFASLRITFFLCDVAIYFIIMRLPRRCTPRNDN